MRDASRRRFCQASLSGAASFALSGGWVFGQTPSGGVHPDLAAIDHDRILAKAANAMEEARALLPITSARAKRSPGTANDYYSEPEEYFPAKDAASEAPWVRRVNEANPDAFTQDRKSVV